MNGILDGYVDLGYRLTVRQLYYQLVIRNLIANPEREYDRVVRLCTDARLAGLISWSVIEDRLRQFVTRQRWQSAAEILQAVASSYHQDMWKMQAWRVFVVVEKDALSGILQPVCRQWDVPLLAARGYPSVSVLREFVVEDLLPAFEASQDIAILHLGDHDPSGIDMTRDLKERLSLIFKSPCRRGG
jgi:hypothetical protein